MDFSARCLLRVFFYVMVFSFPCVAGSQPAEWTHFGTRPLGMGNAFVSVADDFNALFYNPAGLARLKEMRFEIINPRVEVSYNTISLARDLVKDTKGQKSLDDILDLMREQSGLPHYFALGFTPHVVAPHWGVGIGSKNFLSLTAHSYVVFETEVLANVLMPISYADSLLEDRLSWGVSLKPVAAVGIQDDINVDDLDLFRSDTTGAKDSQKQLDQLMVSGVGVGADVGLLFTPIEPLEPTLGLSITDVGGTAYKQTISTRKAPPLRQPSFNTGVSLKPLKTERTYLLLALDSHSINQPLHYSQKFNLGMEWGFSRIIKVQAGLKSGYPTAGLQIDVELLKLRLATYTVDHGPVVGLHEKLAERRFIFEIKLLI
ncbi:MAG: hypothetical protein HYW48_10830 [Deltaproteobacteria bacterium]|nr:hypothetical protein [Deltaproteobacteria bacterium]